MNHHPVSQQLKQSQVIEQLLQPTQTNRKDLEKEQGLKRVVQKSNIIRQRLGQKKSKLNEEGRKVEERVKREWLKVKWEELRVEEVEPRAKWEELKVGEEAELRVMEVGLKEEVEGEEESRGLVSPRSVTREVEPTITEGLWLTGRETEE